jgi:protein MpaA
VSRAARAAVLLALVGCLLHASAPTASATGRAVLGHSLRGRPIVAAVQGSEDAPLRVLVVGCVHGDEPAGARVARSLIAAPAPRRAQLWIVPTLNPDGLAAGTRGNARGVDLNRNFPFGWRSLGGLEYSGTGPLSEPEGRAAARLTREIRPDLAIWFHQPFGVVDRSGGNPNVERRFARLVGLPYRGIPRPPGSATSWQNQVLPGSTAFVAELPAVVSGTLVRRAARAVRTVASELASPTLAPAVRSG